MVTLASHTTPPTSLKFRLQLCLLRLLVGLMIKTRSRTLQSSFLAIYGTQRFGAESAALSGRHQNTMMIRVHCRTLFVLSLHDLSCTHWEMLITTARSRLLKTKTSHSPMSVPRLALCCSLVEEEEEGQG
ncbi:hypothetical protein F5887DRAFT_1025897 [Amanita rubescens]|nr:hypothetical protein F5887DRAFT_1025897 [Amanita rubescens]